MQFLQNNSYRIYFIERFGIPEYVLNTYTFWERGRKVWAFSGELWDINGVEVFGIKALTKGRDLKPSTAFLRIVGKYAKKNVIFLDDNNALAFLRGRELNIDYPADGGYVVVRWKNDVLGCGFYVKEERRLISLIPSKYRLQETWV